jgi:predicted lipid-binding transport protein (Tim44 family)
MADITPLPNSPVEQTNPADVGTSTSEFKLTLGTIIGILSAGIVGVTALLKELQGVYPGAAWIAVGLTVLGTLGSIVFALRGYTASRAQVKVALANVVAAQTIAASSAAAGPSSPTLVPPRP